MTDRLDEKRQSRLLSTVFWLLVISWLMIPFSAITSHMSYYLGNGIITIFGAGAVILSLIGLAKKSTRSGWFALSLILAILTLLYGITDIKFPAQT